MNLEWDVVFATQRNPGRHILMAHIPGCVLDERRACYHVDDPSAAYWWMGGRQTGLGIGTVDTLEVVKRLFDNGYLHHLLRLTEDRAKKLRPTFVEKCAVRMIMHLQKLKAGK